MNCVQGRVRTISAVHENRLRHLCLLGMLTSVLLSLGCSGLGSKGGTAWGDIPTAAGSSSGTSSGAVDVPGADRDRDGVTDDRERAMGSKPDDPDSDDDGYTDGFEDRLADFGYDLLRADADRDRDGLPDALERELRTNPEAPDTDGDGWGDFDEELNRYFGFDPRTATADSDFDGLSDELEKRLGSSPTKVDSNGDGIGDFPAYNADQSPVGPTLKGGIGELVGITYSPAMAKAIEAAQRDPRTASGKRDGAGFPPDLARELPFPT